MVKSLRETTTLHNGVKMPWLGLGVFEVEEGNEVEKSVEWALKEGYRSIDTASVYKNEVGVGKAVKESGIPREELFITTKIWNKSQGYDSTLQAFERSLERLDMDYVDLYLIHWPVEGKYKDTWRALEKLYNDGVVKAIGVSNFQIHHIEELIKDGNVKPMVNQVEYHPLLTQKPLLSFCKENQIQLEAWSPFMHGEIFGNDTIKRIAEKYNKSEAQIILRWDLQNGVVTIPKSVREHRIQENANVFDFELTSEDMQAIDQLNQDKRWGPDPDNFDF